ncbi:MAG: hypothetical protein LBF89_05415 [Bacteroidales bacterium]|jgi:hypothetical protein|nr:hypothetical protein [Bacteroidales bacterium]
MTAFLNIQSCCVIRRQSMFKDGKKLFETQLPDHSAFLSALYRKMKTDYRKFFKMDRLSKLAFLASEALLDGQIDRSLPHPDIAVILFNRSASLDADSIFQQSIRRPDSYYPSPSEFVYTLPNIMTGEIAIRNRIFGETACFVGEYFDTVELCRKVTDVFDDTVQECLCGWAEYFTDCEAALFRIVKETEAHNLFTPANIQRLMTENSE